jgi:hypothetical protein
LPAFFFFDSAAAPGCFVFLGMGTALAALTAPHQKRARPCPNIR